MVLNIKNTTSSISILLLCPTTVNLRSVFLMKCDLTQTWPTLNLAIPFTSADGKLGPVFNQMVGDTRCRITSDGRAVFNPLLSSHYFGIRPPQGARQFPPCAALEEAAKDGSRRFSSVCASQPASASLEQSRGVARWQSRAGLARIAHLRTQSRRGVLGQPAMPV